MGFFKCNKCYLSLSANPVSGEGNTKAKIMIIGESPGYTENKTGIPFIGKSGELLNKYLDLVDLKRKDCYITNVVKCMTYGNTTPRAEEMKACRHYIINEIAHIKPSIIVLLGNSASSLFFKRRTIKSLRYKFTKFNNTYVIATYHPSYILHNEFDISFDFKTWYMVKDKLNDLFPYYEYLNL